MRALATFLLGVIAGLVLMFALVKQGYIRAGAPNVPGTVVLGQTPPASPQETPAASSTVAPAPTLEASARPESSPTPEATAAPETTASPAGTPVAGNPIAAKTFVWTGPQATITYSFHADGTYDANYFGTEGRTRSVGISKGTWALDGAQLTTRETAGVTRRTTGTATTSRPSGAGDVTFTVGGNTLTDAKGRVYNRL